MDIREDIGAKGVKPSFLDVDIFETGLGGGKIKSSQWGSDDMQVL